MKMMILLLSLIVPISLFSSFHVIKEKEYSLYYESSFNPFTLEYIVNLAKTIGHNFKTRFGITNSNKLDFYLYSDRGKFMQDQSAQWWENYEVRSNSVYLCNVDLLLEKNFLQVLLKFLIYKINLLDHYQEKVPEWLLTGMAILYSDKNLFPNRHLKFDDFPEVISRFNKYRSAEELDQVHYYCYKAAQYLFDNYSEKGFYQYLKGVRNLDEFSAQFINLTGTTYPDFLHMLLGHLN